MNENENLVTEVVAENTEQTVEQTPKMFTQEEVNDIVGKRVARKEARIRKDYERRYAEQEELIDVLKAGTGIQSVGEMTGEFAKFYQDRGKKINKKPAYSAEDIETLARAEATEIINGGYEEVVEEVDRMAQIGAEGMTDRERAVFVELCKYREKTERGHELAKIGVTEEEYNSKEFQDFARKFASNTPIADIFDIYHKTKPKKEFKTMGSMKSTTADTNTVKEFYSYEEAMKFTKADFDKNPALLRAVENSMQKW